jgi:hypothetical protein
MPYYGSVRSSLAREMIEVETEIIELEIERKKDKTR